MLILSCKKCIKNSLFRLSIVIFIWFLLSKIVITTSDLRAQNIMNINLNTTKNFNIQKNNEQKDVYLSTYGKKMPHIQVMDLDGNMHNIKDLITDKKFIIMHFWTSWSLNSVDELIKLEILSKKLSENDIEDIMIMPISIDFKNMQFISNIYKKNNILHLPLFINSDKTTIEKFDIKNIPITVLFDKSFTEIARIQSSTDWSQDKSYNVLLQIKDFIFNQIQ